MPDAYFSYRGLADCLRKIVSKFSVVSRRIQHLFHILVVLSLAEMCDRMELERTIKIQTHQFSSCNAKKAWTDDLCRIAKAQKH